MKIGIFDSGLGGLHMTKVITQQFPAMDLVYFGDTLHMPYGPRSDEAIYKYVRRGVEFLFSKECVLIVLACNTASARALRRIQQDYLPQSPYRDRNVLGVIVPTLEAAIQTGHEKLGLLATQATVNSNVYAEELAKIDSSISLSQVAAPLLVPMIEHQGEPWLDDVLGRYLAPLKERGIQSLILGCTHYAILRQRIASCAGVHVQILSQDDIIPYKLRDYLDRHPEYHDKITYNSDVHFYVSDRTPHYVEAAQSIFSRDIHIQQVDL